MDARREDERTRQHRKVDEGAPAQELRPDPEGGEDDEPAGDQPDDSRPGDRAGELARDEGRKRAGGPPGDLGRDLV